MNTSSATRFAFVLFPSWCMLGMGLLIVAAATVPNLPRWVVMWLLAGGIYLICKWRTVVGVGLESTSTPQMLVYLFVWPGLDAEAFLHEANRPIERPIVGEWWFALAKAALGANLLWIVAPRMHEVPPLLVGWLGMVGLIFVLHFGTFHLLSCFYRASGIDATPLMNWPVLAQSVTEFWGRRWNRAFRDFAHKFLFRPLTRRYGARLGLLAGFLFSGLVHDAVISLPAGGGYGRPTLFFLIQAAAIFAERSRLGRASGLGSGIRGWLFTMLVLLVPLGLLFHPPFVENIILPFMSAIGAR